MFRQIILIVIAASVCAAPLAASAASCTANTSGTRITGYAWSETIGWIDMSCKNSNTCAQHQFGLYVDNAGNVSGCAWSENVGWITATQSDLTGCPSGTCSSIMTPTQWTGWLRAISPVSDLQAGGWDGWISLGGSSPNYGISISNGTMSGWGWGDTNVGWVDFSQVHTAFACTPTYTCNGNIIQNSCDSSQNVTCTAPSFCSPGIGVCLFPSPSDTSFNDHSGHLEAKPSLIAKGRTTTLFWNVANVANCTVNGTDGETFYGAFSGISGTSTRALLSPTTFTLNCTALDSTHYSETTSVTLLPVVQEK